MERTGALDYLPKKEAIRLRHERDKLERNLGGIQDLERLPDAVFVIDTKKEHIAVNEARKLGIPVIAIVDTNCDPDEVDFVDPRQRRRDPRREPGHPRDRRRARRGLRHGQGRGRRARHGARGSPAPPGPRSTAAPARVEENETPTAEDAAEIAASTVFEPDAPGAPSLADARGAARRRGRGRRATAAGAEDAGRADAAAPRPVDVPGPPRPPGGAGHERRHRRQVKQLRDATGAGMMDCKKALDRDRGRLRPGRRAAAREGPCLGRQARRPVGRPGPRSTPTCTSTTRSACSSRSTARPTSSRRPTSSGSS